MQVPFSLRPVAHQYRAISADRPVPLPFSALRVVIRPNQNLDFMMRYFLFFILLSCLAACGQDTEPAEDSMMEPVVRDNTLTDSELAEGWELLFDGQSMDNWRVYNSDTLMGWSVEEDAMVALGEGGLHGDGADIITKTEYENFELSLDWKISPGGNSGIFFNVVEHPDNDAVYVTGPEYQLVDDIGFATPLEESQRSGANYAMHAPMKSVAMPAGEYNHSRLRVENGHVTHWLNGEKVVEYDMWTPEWDSLRMAGKWKDFPAYGQARKGYIALQDHGNKIWFKNIKIKKL